MSDFKYTKDQLKAIETTGKNLLISAAAGSGKTAVLTERVIHTITQGVPIDQLVVLTFTNAAAKEMSIRIREKLEKVKHKPYVQKAIDGLETAHFRTFDSYALFLLKKYGYTKNISARVSIGDSVRLSMVAKELIDALFDEHYTKENLAFLNYVRTFETKHDQRLKEQIVYFHTQLSLHADFDEQIEQFGATYYSESTFQSLFSDYETYLEEMKKGYAKQLNRLESELSSPHALEHIESIKSTSHAFLQSIGYEETAQALVNNPDFPESRGVSQAMKKAGFEDEQPYFVNERKKLKDLYTAFQVNHYAKTIDQHRQDFFASGDHIDIIMTLISTFDKRYTAWQIKHELMTFSTVARLAYEIILSEEEIRQELIQSIHEVMIDEYQDTNAMQESFIGLITHQNVYRVGDVKQSIYRFRHAVPSLFTEKYQAYTHHQGGETIDLNANFRSRQEILRDVNRLFERVMDETVGGVSYTGCQKLSYGFTKYDQFQAEHPYGLRLPLLSAEALEDTMKQYRLSRDETEFYYVAQDILKRVGHDQVYDAKLNALRPLAYKDITILSSVSPQFPLMQTIFKYHGIPLKVYRSDAFISYHDIDVYRHLIKSLHALRNPDYYNTHFKHSFLSLSRSYLLSFKDDAILNQTLDLPKKPRALMHHSHETFKPFFTKLMTLVDVAETQTLKNLWRETIRIFDLYGALIKLPQTASSKDRLDYITSLITQLCHQGFSLEDLAHYFDTIVDEGLDVAFDVSSSSGGDDAVSLMTIHKSKGLEFPVVYVVQAKKTFNRSSMRSYDFDNTYGCLLEHESEGLGKSFVHTLKKQKDTKDDLSERLRVLYVALTRAKEQCIVPLWDNKPSIISYDQHGVIDAADRVTSFKSFNDIFLSVKDALAHSVTYVDFTTLSLSDRHRYDIAQKTYHEGSGNIIHYPKKIETKKPVTSTSFSASVNSLLTAEQLASIEFGNTLHGYFELIDFYGDIEAQIDSLTQNQKIKDALTAFFNHPVFKQFTIKKVYKEFPFVLDDEEETYTGYMDLLIETEDAFVIIDYKLKNIDKAHYVDQLKGYESILKRLSTKTISAYLYSILDARFEQII